MEHTFPSLIAQAESTPINTSSVVFKGDAVDPEVAHRIWEKMCEIMGSLSQGPDKVALNTLRLVALVDDFEGAVIECQNELKLPIGTTNMDSAVAVGRTFSWGVFTDDLSKSYSLITLPLWIGQAILNDNPHAKAIFVHECGHVYEDLITAWLNKTWSKNSVYTSDLDGVEKEIASIMWSEFFAELISQKYQNNDIRQNSLSTTIDVMLESASEINMMIRHHRVDPEAVSISDIWDTAITRLSSVLSQVCRSLSQFDLDTLINGEHISSYSALKNDLEERWKEVLRQTGTGISKLQQTPRVEWTEETFEDLFDAIDIAWFALGLCPSYEEERLRIDFVPYPGDRQEHLLDLMSDRFSAPPNIEEGPNAG